MKPGDRLPPPPCSTAREGSSEGPGTLHRPADPGGEPLIGEHWIQQKGGQQVVSPEMSARGETFDPAALSDEEVRRVLRAVNAIPDLSDGAKRLYRLLFEQARNQNRANVR